MLPPNLSEAPQTLLFDADDTLWENNIYFESAIAAFITYLDHQTHTPQQVREHLNTCERSTVAVYGYGLKSFRRSLVRCFEDLTMVPITREREHRIAAFADTIAERQIELLPGVGNTLAELHRRHRLLLVTKGDTVEQTDKLVRSGLAGYFAGVEVLHEKTDSAYREVQLRHATDAKTTWMIGNSPKSDINPALAAGLNAVLIPHDFTWVLEHEVVSAPPEGQALLEFNAFPDLLTHF